MIRNPGAALSHEAFFRLAELATQHHELDDRLHELSAKAYLSEPEQVEEVTLKKRKLHLKDRMEAIVRHYSGAAAAHAVLVKFTDAVRTAAAG